jgi:transcriptional regulator with XRE-family HTH domain
MERMRALRRGRQMTTVELAAKLGKTRGTITRWEKGQRSPNVESLKALARVFGVTIDELVAEVGENLPPPRRKLRGRSGSQKR